MGCDTKREREGQSTDITVAINAHHGEIVKTWCPVICLTLSINHALLHSGGEGKGCMVEFLLTYSNVGVAGPVGIFREFVFFGGFRFPPI